MPYPQKIHTQKSTKYLNPRKCRETAPLIFSVQVACPSTVYTLKECLSPEVGHGEPEDGNLVQLVHDPAVEGQDGSQVVQFPVKPLSGMV